MVNEGDVSFAYTVFNRLLKRVDERVALVDELLERARSISPSTRRWSPIPTS